MKRVTTLTALLFGAALLASAAPASSTPPASPPASDSAPARPAYRYYVACGLSQNAKPSHACRKKRDKGAFFRSNLADVSDTVCVRFPTGGHKCTKKPQKAKQGILYVNEIISHIPGKYKVTWFVGGKRVGLFYFDVTG